jgi:hypothetical protein
MGPTSFGTGTGAVADSGSGDLVTLDFLDIRILVPQGYISGHSLSDSSTYNNQTFSSLGVTPGTYQWTWGGGPDENFTLQAVPEPSAGLLLAVGVLLLAGTKLRQLCP